MMRHHGNKVVSYCQQRLVNISEAQIILQLQPQIPDELERRRHGCRAGAKNREKEEVQTISSIDHEEKCEIVGKQVRLTPKSDHNHVFLCSKKSPLIRGNL
ncbi:hypothetical protein ILYODFUR_039171 [Ilyodon furcidens]|uniref:Uncharacterized protein n=1 Tax=Ilyodon furcidens TaxID=33524 RepID=A0ABV0V9R7_9TELE